MSAEFEHRDFVATFRNDPNCVIFSGNSNVALARDVCEHMGKELGKLKVNRFSDGECNISSGTNVRGKDIYIIQSTSPPVNENLVELLLVISMMRRASARRITAVIPYYGYARQDRKMRARVPISAADVARLLESMGVDRVVAIDLHCGQIQGFFSPRIPVDNLDGCQVGVQHFCSKGVKNVCVVSPDAGGVNRAKKFRDALRLRMDLKEDCAQITLAIIVKQRVIANEVSKMDLVGNVSGKDCILVDDIVDTAGTMCMAAEKLQAAGARNVYAFAAHGLFSGSANERIRACDALDKVVVANTIPLKDSIRVNPKVVQVSVAPLIAEAMARIHTNISVSFLFDVPPPQTKL